MQENRSAPTGASHSRQRRFRRGAYASILGSAAALALAAVGAAPASAAVTPGIVNGSFTVPAGTADASDVQVYLANLYGYATAYANVTDTTPGAATYKFPSVTPGQYYIYFSDTTTGDNVQPDYYGDNGSDDIQSGSVITVGSGATVNLNGVALRTGAAISGTVTDANRSSEASARVYVEPSSASLSTDPNLRISAPVSLTDGSYTLSGLPAGDFDVYYNARGTGSPGWDLGYPFVGSSGLTYNMGGATKYTTTAGATTTVSFSVPAIGTISGAVTSASGPVAGDYVRVFDGAGDQVNDVTTAADGTYSVAVLPGAYKVSFDGFAEPNLAGSWYGGTTEGTAAGVNVGAGATMANINGTLGSGGTITGTVVSAQGATPLGDMEVDLVDAQGRYILSGYTNADGTYSLQDVPAGTWYVRFDDGQAWSGQYYAQEFYGGTQTEFGATGVTVTAGQTTANIDGALLPLSTTALGLPTVSSPALSGLHNNKVAFSFNLAAGAGAGYLKTLTIGLPRGFSWNASNLAADLSLGSGVAFTDTITNGSLVVTLASGEPSVALIAKPGAISVTKAVEKAAGGLTKKPKRHHKKKKKKHHVAAVAKAKHKKKKPVKAKDTIVSEIINLSVGDTTGATTSVPITINHPH